MERKALARRRNAECTFLIRARASLDARFFATNFWTQASQTEEPFLAAFEKRWVVDSPGVERRWQFWRILPSAHDLTLSA